MMDKIEMTWSQYNAPCWQKNQETQWVQGKDSCWMASSETTWVQSEAIIMDNNFYNSLLFYPAGR
ncbi:hypothetical protein [Rickettsiella endosymbiont of Xylota segnis]|uniref:hypothetical protein n=1 Tax=Rickettsiella endosymbiont of Xylota segnis TaxID=3066238 RepID=UPI0030CE50D0